MSRSGGFFYHVRAFRYRRELWKSHEDQTRNFLNAWNPRSKNLLWIGASAGYSVPKEFLDRFETITLVEPDLIAKILWKIKFRRSVEWCSEPVDFDCLENFSSLKTSDQAILFSNLLGQIEIKNSSEVRESLFKFVRGHEWASYHDALSGPFRFDASLGSNDFKKLSEAQLQSSARPLSGIGSEMELIVHLAPDLFQPTDALKFYYWEWRILPVRSHLIEGVASSGERA